MILEAEPSIIQELKRFIPIYSDLGHEIIVKGPIKEPTGCFWKIKTQENVTVGYLLGSIHSTPNYLLGLNSRIRKCFDKSNRLALEMADRQENREWLTLRRKQRWAEQYRTFTPEDIERISSLLKQLFPEAAEKIDFNNEEEMRAFIDSGISTLVSKLYSELQLFSGIDSQLEQWAKMCGKPVEELETLEQYNEQKITQEQVASSYEIERDAFLRLLSLEELTQLTGIEEIMSSLIEQCALEAHETLQPSFDAWEAGDLERFDHSEDYSAEKGAVMTQRNTNMAKRIVSLVRTGEKIFCCVGAAHTGGPDSVLVFLNQDGFTTERVFIK